METQENLKIGIGTKEVEALKPATVKIVKVRIEEVGDKKNKKVVCSVKHPDREEPIDISTVKYERNDKIQTVGLWLNLDEDNLIRKGSALAVLLTFLKAETIEQLEDKEITTIQDDKGYLCFKAY